ncbi:Crp/Fnr family transcriptional regulator [Oscillatoria sp. FACHB-1407]|uniref:Crp/Fnr family transcriptional regulator n=1 Tax=Oscillatoria sp. FACHB-1407 TaxID=2692847 RepID=UPI0016851721|nr:Crp/Fnr family transcriptional regulator [Oscillatoria sp. FACHB-1407]MBD2464690.1 Crp/Fnr family transcriptional regulator [Oscillatoria sp. FACHB-1407]
MATNFILDSLPPVEHEWLQPKLREVYLQQNDILYRVGEPIQDVYFPTTCLLSWTKSTEMGELVEVSITGYEGVAGMILLLNETISPWQTDVQLAGKAFKLSTEDFINALGRSPVLHQRVAAFASLKMVQISQSALCNRFHSLEERLCRWLLSAQDHSNTSEFLLTREILAGMIGAGRPAVSLATTILQSAGLIRTTRGSITILNREGMEEAACECYQVFKGALDRYLAQEIHP